MHIADLVTVASSYIRAWIPAVEGLGAKIACSLAVVDRDQGGSQILADAGCPLTTLVVIKPELFETAHKMGRITDKQLALVLHFIDDPDAFMRSFLLAHPDFLANELAKGGKSAQRAQLCIDSGFCGISSARTAAMRAGSRFTPFRARSFPTASPFQGTCAGAAWPRQR